MFSGVETRFRPLKNEPLLSEIRLGYMGGAIAERFRSDSPPAKPKGNDNGEDQDDGLGPDALAKLGLVRRPRPSGTSPGHGTGLAESRHNPRRVTARVSPGHGKGLVGSRHNPRRVADAADEDKILERTGVLLTARRSATTRPSRRQSTASTGSAKARTCSARASRPAGRPKAARSRR